MSKELLYRKCLYIKFTQVADWDRTAAHLMGTCHEKVVLPVAALPVGLVPHKPTPLFFLFVRAGCLATHAVNMSGSQEMAEQLEFVLCMQFTHYGVESSTERSH